MKRPRLILIAIVVVAALATFLLSTVSRIPTYQGQTVYDLMFALKYSALEDSPGFMAIGSNAVPFLAEALRIERTKYDRYGWVRTPRFQKLVARWKLGFTWSKSATEVHRSATFALLAFSFESRPALPELHAALMRPNNDNRQTVVHCLSELGPLPESIPWLVKAFPLTTNEWYGVRHDLLNTLGKGGTNAAAQAMPLVVASLRDHDEQVRLMAAQILARWAQPSPQAIPDLLPMLSSTNDSMVMSAAWAIGRITNRCDEALPGVHLLLASTNDFYRAVAAMTLWCLGGDAGETRRTLEGLLRSQPGKGVAATSLGQMGPAARDSIPALIKAAHESLGSSFETYDRARCAKAVLLIQGETPEMYPVLEEAITSEKNWWYRATMIEQIAEIGPSARPIIPVLQRALNDPQRNVRHEAALALEKLKALR